jgi:hypothetical protein
VCQRVAFGSKETIQFLKPKFPNYTIIQNKQLIKKFKVNLVVLFLRCCYYSVFHLFRQAKFENGVTILSPIQLSLLPQLPQKTKLASKVVKTDSKIIISLPKI